MATTTLATEIGSKIIETHTNITFLNKLIDFSKKSPSGVYNVVSVRLDQIKTNWNQLKQTIPSEHRYFQAVDLQIVSTEKKVEKLLKKDLSQLQHPVEQIKQRANARGYIVFFDSKADPITACFGNYHPCKFEFGEKVYQNAESAFQAQKYKDQPDIMSKFEQTDGSAARQLASKYDMSQSLRQEWQSNSNGKVKDIMMHVLRAKFGQNPEFKEKLMATGNAYLVKHSAGISDPRETFWGDGSNGQGNNVLGTCLVKLRGEYGGSGTIADYKPEELNMLYQTYSKQAPANASPQTQNEDVAAAQAKKEYQDVNDSIKAKYMKEITSGCNQQ